jgi:hypothetical protein
MKPNGDVPFQQDADSDASSFQASGIGVAAAWLAFYVLIIVGAATTNFRSEPMLEISASARTQ